MAETRSIKKGDNRGITLTEMIVTFALVAIFMATAVSIITSAVVTHSELTASMYAQSVSEILMDKVTGELAAANADNPNAMTIGTTGKLGGTEGNGASFYDRDGRAVTCFVQNGLLKFHYQEVVKVLDDGEVFAENAYDWGLDEKTYMGFRITDMQINRIDDKNVIEVILKIKNLKTGIEYTASKCTKCYNFKSESDYTKINPSGMLSF